MVKQYIGISRDHSGSMNPIRTPAMNDYNSQITSLKQASIDYNIPTTVTTVICDGRVTTETINTPIQNINPIRSYFAGGMTPLYDSVNELIELLSKFPDADNPETCFLIQVITDGEENASRNVSASTLKSKIQKLQQTDRWTFTFRVPRGYRNKLIRDLGLFEGNVIEWDQTAAGMEVASQATTNAYKDYYVARSTGKKSTKGFYSNLTNVSSSDVKSTMKNISNQLEIFSVDKDDEAILKFMERKTKKPFVKGTAFYELTKYERAVQDHKKIVIQDLKGGSFYEGAAARRLLGFPDYGTISLSPGDHSHYKIFIQSTSVNRKLKRGTSVLYWNAA